LSQYSESKTTVIKVKGVSFNYVQFLWSRLGVVIQAHSKGMFSEALRLVTDLINYLPDSIKEEFKAEANAIQATMNKVKTGNVPQLKKITDYYVRGLFKKRLLENYASVALNSFIDRLTSRLNDLGYMENTEKLQEGEDDWYREHNKQQAQKKRDKAATSKTKAGQIFENLP
jgi:hypothetical protein